MSDYSNTEPVESLDSHANIKMTAYVNNVTKQLVSGQLQSFPELPSTDQDQLNHVFLPVALILLIMGVSLANSSIFYLKTVEPLWWLTEPLLLGYI